MKITNKENAINIFINSVMKHSDATVNGDGKECNKIIKKLFCQLSFY